MEKMILNELLEYLENDYEFFTILRLLNVCTDDSITNLLNSTAKPASTIILNELNMSMLEFSKEEQKAYIDNLNFIVPKLDNKASFNLQMMDLSVYMITDFLVQLNLKLPELDTEIEKTIEAIEQTEQADSIFNHIVSHYKYLISKSKICDVINNYEDIFQDEKGINAFHKNVRTGNYFRNASSMTKFNTAFIWYSEHYQSYHFCNTILNWINTKQGTLNPTLKNTITPKLNFISKEKKSYFMELVVAIYQSNEFIDDEGNPVTQKLVLNELKKAFNIDWTEKQLRDNLSKYCSRKKLSKSTPFLDKLKVNFQEKVKTVQK